MAHKSVVPNFAIGDMSQETWDKLRHILVTMQRQDGRNAYVGGALVKRSTNLSIANSSNTDVTWEDTVYDDQDFWDGSNATRLTVPGNFQGRVIAKCHITWDINSTGIRDVEIKKNGSNFDGMASMRVDASGSGQPAMTVATAMVGVDGSDYFEAEVFQDSGGALDVMASPVSWFSIELYGIV